eukprot:1894869-Amphidinium_carterae.1
MYPGTKDLLDTACKTRFSQYKKGVATPMLMTDLTWSKRFVSLCNMCTSESPLPKFVHEMESTCPITGEKKPERDIKPEMPFDVPVPAMTAAPTVRNETDGSIDAPSQYTYGLGCAAGLASTAAPSREAPAVTVKSESNVCSQRFNTVLSRTFTSPVRWSWTSLIATECMYDPPCVCLDSSHSSLSSSP